MDIKFVKFTMEFNEKSWEWLNDKEIKTLTNSPNFSKEEQLKWFSNLKNNKQYLIWGILVDSIPVGAAGLKRITKTNACVFWYIGEKSYWNKGIGIYIASEITRRAKKLGLDYLYGEPLIENFKSINLLFREGYKIIEYKLDYYILKKTL